MMKSKLVHVGIVCTISLCMTTIVLAGSIKLVSLKRLDGHLVYINPANLNTVQSAGQLGYPMGTLVSVGAGTIIVQENVNQVIEKLRSSK